MNIHYGSVQWPTEVGVGMSEPVSTSQQPAQVPVLKTRRGLGPPVLLPVLQPAGR